MASKPYKNPEQTALFILIALFLLSFLIVPVAKVFYVAFVDVGSGALTLVNFKDFFNIALFQESFFNSFYVAGMSVALATMISLPLAYFTTRFEFKGAVVIQSLGFIPLIMPPFVGAVAMGLLFGAKVRTLQRVVLPLMSGGLMAGFVTSFATAAVELSATIMLVSTESDAPLAYGIYVFMQSAAGRDPGAALGMVAVVIVALGIYFSHRIIEKGRRERSVGNHRLPGTGSRRRMGQ
uniref:ABC-type spermidine/putrescine transport system, permease component II n=1 Tax=Candidatus Kentrum sp. LPFa TaxID=2126335 RepID=A0A450W6S5_9GAMM|nr:MAG: ABC-type spermidine/putrescine transport system, permease component II [Candidatus Kentron sp. LPFa]